MTEGSSSRNRRFSRRDILSSGAILTAGLAGCAGNGTEETTTEQSTTTEETTSEQTKTTTSPDEPVEVPEDATCAVCEMKPAEYEEENGQLAYEDGTREFFCSPGCAVAYYTVPDHFNAGYTREDIASLWIHDYSTKSLSSGLEAEYVLELSGENVDLPMKNNPVPFADREDAIGFTEEFDQLTEHDIVRITAFDLPLAHKYRAHLLPENDEKSILDPVSVPMDSGCGVCNMKPAEYPDANSQLSFSDGGREFFCSPGCLTAYYGDPGHFSSGRERDDIVGVWDRDYGTKEIIDADHASYVLENQGDRVELPMMMNPVPFELEANAIEYVNQYDDLTEEDIISLLSFDRDLAKTYRGKFF